MRWLSRLLVVVIICLVLIPVATAPAQADGASITLSRSNGVPGENVTVHGYNFTGNKWVDIYYYLDTTNTTNRIWVKDVQVTSTSSFTVTFTVPESCTGDHKVRAEEAGTTVYAEAYFTAKPGLTVSPEEGPVGTTVIVEGHGFAKSEGGIELRYYLNSSNSAPKATNIEADDYGWWTGSFVIPASAKGSHKIDAKGDSSSLAAVEDVFLKVTPGISLNKLSSSPGESITMTGNGFAANERDIRILFAGEEIETEIRVDADANGHWDKGFEVPEMPKGTYNVTAYGESTPKAAVTARSFEIKPGLVLSPAEGHVGTDLTVIGGGFAADEDVSIKYDGSQQATDTTDNKGSFDVSFVVPESQHGQHQVTAEDAAGNDATAIFTMESVPPGIPELISPSDGSRVGLIGKVRPTFEWSAVPDESGVRYSLQIATSDNVTATGEFAHPLVSVGGLVGTNYTLNATEALSYGTYYWIVQAVDRAENEGNWTAARSFRAGLLPLWAFIVIIAAIVVLIGALVYFFVIRKRIPYY